MNIGFTFALYKESCTVRMLIIFQNFESKITLVLRGKIFAPQASVNGNLSRKTLRNKKLSGGSPY